MRITLKICLLLTVNTHAQIHLYNSSLTDTTQAIVYRGFDNQIKVFDELENDLVLISSDGDTLEYYDNSYHFKRPQKRFDTLLILKNNKIIGEQIFKSELLSPPTVLLKDVQDSIATKDELLANPGLIVTYKAQLIQSFHIVIKFKFNIQYNHLENLDSDSLTIGIGSTFNKSHLSSIEKMSSGDIISIEYVETRHPWGTSRRIPTPNLVFRIK